MSESPEAITTARSSRDDFVRHLRHRAERAAEASVHHASLSQQYLDLSQKFAQLAEQAGSTELTELKQTLATIEQQMPTPETSQVPDAPDPIQPPAMSPPSVLEPPAPGPPADSTKPPAEPQPAGLEQISTPEQRESENAEKHPAPPEARKLRGNRRNRIRWIQRVRSVAVAARRIRVKANKADLQPRQRTATEEIKKGSSSILTSVVVVAILLMLLGTSTFELEADVTLEPIMAGFADEVQEVEDPMPIEPPEEEPGEQLEAETEEPAEESDPEPDPEPENPPMEEPEPEPEESEPTETEMAETEMPLPETDQGTEPTAAASDTSMAAVDNRSTAGKKAMLQKYGGSVASESAVSLALDWLVTVQHPQGYWDFVYTGEAGNAGTINNPIGGTAYALLPFLAAGQTHQEGKYRKQVQAGLNYLTKIGLNAPAGYDLRGMINKQSKDKEPNEAYYVHGAATLALCEAYGMTRDRRLRRPAEGAIQFIVNSQDPQGGGWRYNPQEPGSTSVTAIQVMALMAAKKAGLKVPERTLKGVMHYLDTVQVDREGRYGYEIEKKQYKGSITAMALLCRMYLGWGRDDGDMQHGVALLDKAGPYENLYSVYFATQVMKNWGGKEWERWNLRLRDDLVSFQETDGPGKGSWKPRTGAIHAKQGGRLLSTVLAALTLEVYYRYKPLLPEPVSPAQAEQ